MQLIVCEKPRVAQKIASALAEGEIRIGKFRKVKYYILKREGQEICVAPAVGHVYSLDQKSGEKNSYPVFDVDWRKAYEVEKEAHYTKDYIELLEELGKKADEIIIACDYDIEGSLIGYNVLRFACGRSEGARMKFSTLTSEELIEAYEKRTGVDVLNAKSGEARHILDWIWGINLSRALMEAIRKRGSFKIMSIGRVQGPALSILAKREKEILQFKPTPYWEVLFEAKGVTFTHEKERFEKREEAKKAYETTSKEGRVIKIEKKEYLQPAPSPFDLTSLQIEAHACLGIDPKRTLDIAQRLYEASLISYPRTSSQKLPLQLRLPLIIQRLSQNPKYSEHARALIANKRFTPKEGKKEDAAHPAIHPTGIISKLEGTEEKLYDLIVRRFLSTFAEPARRESQKIIIEAGSQRYRTSGNRTLFEGWFEIYKPYLRMEEVSLPSFAEGEIVKVEGLRIVEKRTKPPKRYTPASIIAELERMGLGTKGTRAVIIDTLFKRGYIHGKQIRVTPFGMSVYETLSENVPEIMDEGMTRKLEYEMERIQNGEIQEEIVIENGKRLLEEAIVHLNSLQNEVGKALSEGLVEKKAADSILGKCRCGHDIKEITSKSNKRFAGCSNYPNCSITYPLPQEGKIEPLGSVCETCGTPQIKVSRKRRKAFIMCLDPNCATKEGWGEWKSKKKEG
ncbi:MAG: DNA topoisomerase I [Candidatus Anstonellales archaeon]